MPKNGQATRVEKSFSCALNPFFFALFKTHKKLFNSKAHKKRHKELKELGIQGQEKSETE